MQYRQFKVLAVCKDSVVYDSKDLEEILESFEHNIAFEVTEIVETTEKEQQ